jgi:hypothetical protein
MQTDEPIPSVPQPPPRGPLAQRSIKLPAPSWATMSADAVPGGVPPMFAVPRRGDQVNRRAGQDRAPG